MLSLRMGLDIWEVIDAAATKLFGFQPFYPGDHAMRMHVYRAHGMTIEDFSG